MYKKIAVLTVIIVRYNKSRGTDRLLDHSGIRSRANKIIL